MPDYNPVWCSYGPGSRMAFLIGQDGKLYNVQASSRLCTVPGQLAAKYPRSTHPPIAHNLQAWFHATTMAGAMEEYKLLVAMAKLEKREQSSTSQLELLAVIREVAYAQMEKGLRTTLDKVGRNECAECARVCGRSVAATLWSFAEVPVCCWRRPKLQPEVENRVLVRGS